ncbi:Receptor-like serine/threonine-protein kinase [Heracleum sosnowskyi]|uniref:Receptor-like serine/threonine-protein kinase n=1 Tax=Heracleum sosnowskyi TaxID=360622 RepID=A0AAD8N8A9_9APIA|nr:Receptor-like serine/threonine-protein kinase [Heracleum sosnowskyi]
MSKVTKCFSLILFSSFFIVSSAAGDILSANQTIKSGETIVSAGSVFELGFFSLGSSKNQYLSIRYKHASAITVRVFNPDAPLADGSGMFRLSSEGTLTLNLLNAKNTTIWSSNSSTSLKNPVAQLLDSGNLVIRAENESDSGNFIWQSFDFPDNTFLPGMKLGRNLATGLDWSFNSWKSNDDPSPGNFQVKLDVSGYPQLFLWNGSAKYIRIGPWNGLTWSGIATAGSNNIFEDELGIKEEEIYFKYEPINGAMLIRLVVMPDGQVIRYTWTNQSNKWDPVIILQADYCDDYARCGAYGSCNVNSLCSCLDGFQPQNSEALHSLNSSEGCVPKTQFNCSNRDDFVLQSNKKWPDTQNSSYDFSTNLEDCKKKCLENCSCTAYVITNITGEGSGCLLWFGGLTDIRDQEQRGRDFYVRVVASGSGSSNSSRARRTVLIVLVPIISISTVVLGFYLWHVCKHTKKREGPVKEHAFNDGSGDLPVFDFRAIADATNNFSNNNKLGEGGFGPVYKGILEDGKEIAVKRRSKCSTQGIEEFKNEVSCIAKLQHRNLVRLLGWSTTEEGERILVYEYMPNKSLDFFIFGDMKQRASLDWPKRYKIINGITKGILYLHEDSRLRVIHRDLKASNILLDYNMNPKISDFGMARSFGDSETESNTARVVGTYGYMSPEYAMEGAFSVKSDVYSFGVLLIEIVSGQKCRFFNHPSHNLNLMGHAWKSYKEDRLLELIDASILESSVQYEAFRVIQIGLLCVQQYPEDRPNMSSVLLMLTSKAPLPHPKQPGFFTERKLDEADTAVLDSSISDQTVSLVTPR